MKSRRKMDRDSLRELGLPKALGEEMLKVDALGIERPVPTAELVRKTLERCEAALKALGPPKGRARAASPTLGPAFRWHPGPVPALVEFAGTLIACVSARAVPFAKRNPKEPAMLLVDNHGVIDPELWASDPSLVMLHNVYRGADEAVEAESGRSIDRLIVLKENLDEYDERDLEVIRKAIKDPVTKDTYIVAARNAGRFRERGCAVVAKEVLFEIEKGETPDSFQVKNPGGVKDVEKAHEVYREFLALKKKAFPVYVAGRMNPKLKTALGSKAKLLKMFKSLV